MSSARNGICYIQCCNGTAVTQWPCIIHIAFFFERQHYTSVCGFTMNAKGEANLYLYTNAAVTSRTLQVSPPPVHFHSIFYAQARPSPTEPCKIIGF